MFLFFLLVTPIYWSAVWAWCGLVWHNVVIFVWHGVVECSVVMCSAVGSGGQSSSPVVPLVQRSISACTVPPAVQWGGVVLSSAAGAGATHCIHAAGHTTASDTFHTTTLHTTTLHTTHHTLPHSTPHHTTHLTPQQTTAYLNHPHHNAQVEVFHKYPQIRNQLYGL